MAQCYVYFDSKTLCHTTLIQGTTLIRDVRVTKETAKEINRRVVLPIVYVQHCQENLKFLLELLANFLTFPAPYIMRQQQHRMCISCLRRLFVHYSLCCFAR